MSPLWLIPAAVVGSWLGFTIAAILAAAKDDK